jgi:hypothetical protein
MTFLIWAFFAVLGLLVLWEAVSRARSRWMRSSGRASADPDPVAAERYYAPESERRREADAAASRADHSAASGMIKRAEPRRNF